MTYSNINRIYHRVFQSYFYLYTLIFSFMNYGSNIFGSSDLVSGRAAIVRALWPQDATFCISECGFIYWVRLNFIVPEWSLISELPFYCGKNHAPTVFNSYSRGVIFCYCGCLVSASTWTLDPYIIYVLTIVVNQYVRCKSKLRISNVSFCFNQYFSICHWILIHQYSPLACNYKIHFLSCSVQYGVSWCQQSGGCGLRVCGHQAVTIRVGWLCRWFAFHGFLCVIFIGWCICGVFVNLF